MAEKRLRGICVVCRRDLYRDPLRHFLSASHAQRVRGWEARREREQRRRREAQQAT